MPRLPNPHLPARPLLALLALLGLAAPAAGAAPWAGVLTPENAPARQAGGPDAVGGVGDHAFGNGTICGVVSHPDTDMDVSLGGGFLVDLGHCGRGDDHLSSLVPLVNVSRSNVPRVTSVTSEHDEAEARVRTVARWEGIELQTDYVVDRVDPTALRIETTARRVAENGRFVILGLLSVHPSGTIRTFRLDTQVPELSTGFDHPPSPGEEWSEIFRGLERADVQVMLADDGFGGGIAYGIQLESARRVGADGEAVDLPMVALNGIPFSLVGVFTQPFWVGGGPRLGLLELAQGPLMDLDEGDRLEVRHTIRVGDRPGVSTVTDALWPEGPEVRGHVDDPAARLHVARDGHPATHVRPGADGRFAFRVPEAGGYEIRAVAPGDREVILPVEVEADGSDLGRLALGGVGRVILPRGHAMRLVFRGLDGTPDPRFRDDLLGLRFGGDPVRQGALSSDVSLAGVEDDPVSLPLAPGHYRVLATRGIEWSVEETRIRVSAGEASPLTIGIPRRVVDTPDWILADLHVHAGGSFDTTLPYRERIRSFAAMGGEVLVATEHDNVVDYRPVARAMGLGDALRIVPGLEMTSTVRSDVAPFTTGHANVWPLLPEPFAHRGGALRSQGVRLRAPIAELRARGGERVFQLNHPRGPAPGLDDELFFSHLAVSGKPFDPALPLDHAANRTLLDADPLTGVRDLDFDALELLNGATGPHLAAYKRTRADWFSLLLQGERRTATSNSDSHSLGRLVAIPASFVRVPGAGPARLDESAFTAAVLEGQLVGSTGPFPTVRLAKAGPGGTLQTRDSELTVTVQAPDWVPVDTLRVYVNAALVETRPIARGETLTLPLAFEADAFVTVEVQGEVEGDAGDRYRAVAPNMVPFAFTNPIFVDVDGDGWDAPGLPEALPATIADPLSP